MERFTCCFYFFVLLLYHLLFLDYGLFETRLSCRNVVLLCDELLGAVYHGVDCLVEPVGVSQWSEMALRGCYVIHNGVMTVMEWLLFKWCSGCASFNLEGDLDPCKTNSVRCNTSFIYELQVMSLVKTLPAKTLLRDKTLVKERVPLQSINWNKTLDE